MADSSTTIKCPDDVVTGSLITKEKRHELFGTVAGGAGSCKPEIFQRKMVMEGTGAPCAKTNIRINFRTNTLQNIVHPNTRDDGFDYSENFDGVQVIGINTIYNNFKCVVGTGGSQTRTMREVYKFVEGQLKVLLNTTDEHIYFANILDGDEAYSCFSKFNYLLLNPEFTTIKCRVYVGDLKGYFDWLKVILGS